MKIRHKIWLERNEKTIFGKGREASLARHRGTSQPLWGGKKIEHVVPGRLGKAEGLRSKAGCKINLLRRAGQGNAFNAGSKRSPGKI